MLTIALLNQPGGSELLHINAYVKNLEFSTGEHGFLNLSCLVARALPESFYMYDRAGTPHVAVTYNGWTVWEGRVEDMAIVPGGVRLGAFGYWRTMYDAPYTAFWSTDSVADFNPIQTDQVSSISPHLYSFDNLNRLFIAPTKNSVYIHNNDVGSLIFKSPINAAHNIQRVAWDYAILLPNNWTVRLSSYNEGFVNFASEWTLTANGSLQTGSVAQTLAANKDFIVFEIFNATGSSYTYTGETGANYAKFTNVRVLGDAVPITATGIAIALAGYINGINPTQLQAALIEATGLDLRDEIYEDEWPGDILMKLARLGDNQTPPRQWEAGVWENRTLHFRPRGSQGRAWYVDVSVLEMERTIDALRNSAYATYQEAAGRTLRTAVNADGDSVARYGLTRRDVIDVQTTSATQANTHRDAFLNDHKDPIPRINITFDELFDASGARWPLFVARSGDTITIRNLPPTLGTTIDRIRTFRISETRYSADNDVLEVVPESPLPRLEMLMLRRAEDIDPLRSSRRYTYRGATRLYR